MCWKCASAVGEEGWFQMIQSEARSKEDHWQWANHRGWRCKWGWEMGNACPSMTQIATVCLAEKWQRVPTTGLRYMPVWSGNSKWEPGADILTRGGDKKWNLGLGGGGKRGRREGMRQQECESLDQICPSSLSDPATGLLMRPGTRPITRAQCTQQSTTLLHWRNTQHVQHWRNASQHQTTSDQQAVLTSVPEYKSVTTLLHGGAARGKKWVKETAGTTCRRRQYEHATWNNTGWFF